MQEIISPLAPQTFGRSVGPKRAVSETGHSLAFVRRWVLLTVVIGSALQAYANGTVAAVAVALIFFAAGYLIVAICFKRRESELRVFMLTYAVAAVVGGLAQCYSVYVFHEAQNFSDCVFFLGQISAKPPFKQWVELPSDTVLATSTWQQLYAIAWLFGLKFGPYVAVLFNALIMGVSGALTVATGRALFGDDTRKLRRIELLFASCGLFILFGSVLLRDSFVVFFNALWLWAAVVWLVRPTGRTFLIAFAATAISIYALLFLRDEMVRLFAVFIFAAGFFWFCTQKLNATRIALVVVALTAVPFVDNYVASLVTDFRDTQVTGQQNYSNLGAVETSGNTLGTRLVAQQPLPIRLVMSAGTLLVNPIPLWSNFKANASEYHIIEGYNGFYVVLILPLIVVGIIGALSLLKTQGRKAIPLLYVVAYMLLNLVAVTASSRLERHLGQFMAAAAIVAALPNPDDKAERKRVRMISIAWFAAVALIHIAWAAMR